MILTCALQTVKLHREIMLALLRFGEGHLEVLDVASLALSVRAADRARVSRYCTQYALLFIGPAEVVADEAARGKSPGRSCHWRTDFWARRSCSRLCSAAASFDFLPGLNMRNIGLGADMAAWSDNLTGVNVCVCVCSGDS